MSLAFPTLKKKKCLTEHKLETMDISIRKILIPERLQAKLDETRRKGESNVWRTLGLRPWMRRCHLRRSLAEPLLTKVESGDVNNLGRLPL